MYNDISLDSIKKRLKDYLNSLNSEKDKDVYEVLEKSTHEEVTAKEALDNLRNLGSLDNLKDYGENFRDFVSNEIKELELILKVEDEKKDLVEKIKEAKAKNDENKTYLEVEDEKKDLVEKIEEAKSKNDEKKTYLEVEKEKLKKNLKMLKENTYTLEKETNTEGEFEKQVDSKSDSLNKDDLVNTAEISDAQYNLANSGVVYNNPGFPFFEKSYNYFLDKQTENSKINVEVTYDGNNKVEVKLSHKGDPVNKTIPPTTFTYIGEEQMKDYYDEIYPFLIEQHVIDSDTNTFEEQSHLESENSDHETLEVNGDSDEVKEIKHDIDEVKQEKKGTVRKLTAPNNHAKNNNGIIIILLFSIIVVSILIIVLNVFSDYN